MYISRRYNCIYVCCFNLQQHMSIGKIQTLTLLTHQVSINHLFPNIKMHIFLTVLYTFLKVLFWTCHSFVIEYPTVIIKDLQFELSSKTDEHIKLWCLCVQKVKALVSNIHVHLWWGGNFNESIFKGSNVWGISAS